MRSEKKSWFLAGGLVSAVTASFCCIVPLLALGLGAGGFAASSWFAQWRPYFLVASFVLLAMAWYVTYRRPKAACGPNEACSTSPQRKGLKIALWVVTALAVPAALFPTLVPSNPVRADTTAVAGGTELRVAIPSMDCPSCAKGIEGTLRRQPGVRDASVNYDSKQALIVFDASTTNADKLVAAIDSTGFKAEPLKAP